MIHILKAGKEAEDGRDGEKEGRRRGCGGGVLRRGKGDMERKTIQERGHTSSCRGQSRCKNEREELKKPQ